MKRGFLSSKGSWRGRGVKEKQQGLVGIEAKGTNHVPYEDMNLERLQVELHNFGDKAREYEVENK
ncbi:hypothetical protein Tco_0374409, partial [Tanacetum coccineum]